MEVKAWEEKLKILTYKTGKADKNPMFLENRVYQGSSGVVYPYPVIDKVFDDKEDKEYTALFLENDYLKIMILPGLGGRIQMAYDKTNDYHFVYYNRVIKPALVGLAGPWISGGIEFNWPQHHRPSTFEPTDYLIKDNDDGSKTVWVNEYEKMFGTKAALAFTLYPDRAYIELQARLYNRTAFPQTFLWWANPAVHVDEHYQSIFPPDVHAVFDHGKRDASSFPIATGTYYKVDYAPGTDISVYTNIPVPTSYMAVDSAFDFVGGYHHQKKAGMMHVASHHISPGKKQWTWGCGDFGRAWDRHLTDQDGPYFELMCGVFTDNQPDFSWIMPGESRNFKQYFMPYKNIGAVKNATADAMVNLEIANGRAEVKVYVTQKRKVIIRLLANEQEIFNEAADLSPIVSFEESVAIDPTLKPGCFTVIVSDDERNTLVEYTPVTQEPQPMPEPSRPIADPGEIKTNEELFLAGLHLEQYRHATRSPLDYYKEALRRDPNDLRCNNAKGLWLLRRGQFKAAEPFFRRAVQQSMRFNRNPYDGEPLYNLGLCLRYQHRLEEATKHLYKSAWIGAMQDNAYLQLAYISALQTRWDDAFEHSLKSLYKNFHSLKARHIHSLALRITGRVDDAIHFIERTLEIDPFDFASMFEMYKCRLNIGDFNGAEDILNHLKRLINNNSYVYVEMAIQYADAGCYNEAIEFLSMIAGATHDPLIFYYIAYYEAARGNQDAVKPWLHKAFAQSPDRVFPNRINDIAVLDFAAGHNPADFKALYYLGNYYYAKRLYDKAREAWEQSVAINDRFATVLRNLGIAWYNKFDKKEAALELFEKAFSCDPSDSRVLLELDQLYKRFNKPPAERLAFLNGLRPLVWERDDLYLEFIRLHTLTGDYERALELLQSRNFHPWEGGEGKVSGQHVLIHLALAHKAINEGRWATAEDLLAAAQFYPDNLGEGKIYGARENDIFYWLGCLFELKGDITGAIAYWEKAALGSGEPALAFFYNDQQPDKIFYQGLALSKLGRHEEAESRFQTLLQYGEQHLNDAVQLDFFAVSLPDLMIFDDDLNARNRMHCHYLTGLGYLGFGKKEMAESQFNQALAIDPSFAGALIHKLIALSL